MPPWQLDFTSQCLASGSISLYIYLPAFADGASDKWREMQRNSIVVFLGKGMMKGRIVGGQEVIPYTLPYHVGLSCRPDVNEAFCGGALISLSYVLTGTLWLSFAWKLKTRYWITIQLDLGNRDKANYVDRLVICWACPSIAKHANLVHLII